MELGLSFFAREAFSVVNLRKKHDKIELNSLYLLKNAFVFMVMLCFFLQFKCSLCSR